MTEDTGGWHDPIGGMLNAAQVKAKYGEKPHQDFRNEWFQAAIAGPHLEGQPQH